MTERKVFLGSLIVCFLPCLPLFPLHQSFSLDGLNHLWTIDYFSEFFKAHQTTPYTLTTNPVLGIPVPIFYAYHFYSILGVLASFLGSASGLVLVVVSLTILQFNLVFGAVYRSSGDKTLAFVTSTFISWSIYPLTNLYHRGAIPEFVAGCLMTSCVALIVDLVFSEADRRHSVFELLRPGFLYALVAVTHPLTAIYGGGLLLLLVVVSLTLKWRPWLAWFSVFNSVALFFVMCPWIYVLLKLAKYMPFTKNKYLAVIPGIDSLWHRLSPTAFEMRSTVFGNGVDITFPYVDTQINLALFLVASFFGYQAFSKKKTKEEKKITVFGNFFLGIAIVFIIFSSYQSLANTIHLIFGNMQFAYRLVTYICFCSLAAIIAYSRIVTVDRRVLYFTAAISICGLNSKLERVYAIAEKTSLSSTAHFLQKTGLREEKKYPIWDASKWHGDKNATNLFPGYYGHTEYIVDAGFEGRVDLAKKIPVQWIYMEVESGKRFGLASPLEIELKEETLVLTNIQVFPWNILLVDGVKVDPSNIITRAKMAEIPEVLASRSTVGLGVLLNPGTHKLEYDFQPDSLWITLIQVSWATLLVWLLGVLFFGRNQRSRKFNF